MQKNFSHNVWFKLHRWTKKIHEVTQGEDHFAKQSIKGGLTANTAELLEFYRTLEENQVKVIMTQTNPPPPLPSPFLLGIYDMLWYMFSTVTHIMNTNVKKAFFSS